MPGHALDGIEIAEAPHAEQPIARTRSQLTAFVGRTLRGPVDTPLIVHSFADFQRIFGGLWQPSPLSYAVEHFFEQGGRHAVIVRVTNGAQPTTLSLRCDRESLQLEALAPGTREFLRASIDYDHVDTDEGSFNLVVQRVRSPGSERIEEQEIFRNLSVEPSSDRFVGTALLRSQLVRMRGRAPSVRPNPTLMPGTNLPVGYVSSNPDGDDGRPLTDYDLIGSASRRTGLFALTGVADVAFLYLPPLSRTAEIGASTLLVASRFCRDHHALLIVDPPLAWDSTATALRGVKEFAFHSDTSVMFYPRLVCMDRLRGRSETFGNGGAVAGLLSRIDGSAAAMLASPDPEPVLRAGVRLAREVTSADRWRLAQLGINTLQTVRSADRNRPPLRTLACGASASSDWAYLMPRRFAQFVIGAIERGTRWAVANPHDPRTQHLVVAQVTSFMQELRVAGAFASVPRDDAYLVICDERINDARETPMELRILVQFAAIHSGEYHSFMITHSIQGSVVRAVVVNRLEASLLVSDDLQREITIRIQKDEQFVRVLAS